MPFIWLEFFKSNEGLIFMKANYEKELANQNNTKSLNFNMARTSTEVFYNHYHLDIFSAKTSLELELANIAKIIGKYGQLN